jgi:DNA-binding transcriptional MerR regulator/methylmalonyl-CoA mutase cobalamin-binding subunit
MADRYLQIGPFSRRVGVSADLLRAWERRYGVPLPTRTAEGRRLYSPADARQVAVMRDALEGGLPASEAARRARAKGPAPRAFDSVDDGELAALRGRLADALTRFDEAGAQDQLDRLFGAYSTDTALSEVVLPYLRDLGRRWASHEVGVGHEHFASNLIHGRLLSLGRKWDAGHGPRALLAAPSGEQHTLGLLAFGLALRTYGWRITYLGADTPTDALARIAGELHPDQIVLASVRSSVYVDAAAGLAELADEAPLAVAGAGAVPRLAGELGAAVLSGDPVSEAARLAYALAR